METYCKKCGKKLKKTNVIASVKKGSLPDMDGIKPGYKITAIDNVAVQTYEDIINAVKGKESYTITLNKKNDTKDIEADKSYGLFLNVDFEDEKICSSCGAKQKSFFIPLVFLAAIILLCLALFIKSKMTKSMSIPEEPPDPPEQSETVGDDKSNEVSTSDKPDAGVDIGNISKLTPPEDSDSLTDINIKDPDYTGPIPKDLLPVKLSGMAILFPYDKDIPFDYCSVMVKSYAEQYLEKKITRNILVEGDACTYGTEEYNIDLSRRRAEYLKEQLVKRGIPEERIKIKYYGS